MDCEWNDGNLSEIASHGVTPADAEKALDDPERVTRAAYSRGGELRRAIIGVTAERRVLVVIFTVRGAQVRVVSAWPATGKDLRTYTEATR